jgi:hypothetical protein
MNGNFTIAPGRFGAAFDTVEILNFGRDDVNASYQIAAGGGLAAVEIAPESEIDACWLQFPTASIQGGLMGAGSPTNTTPQAVTTYGNNIQAALPAGASALVSVDHPCIGPLPGTITVLPFYQYNKTGGAINAVGSTGVAKLSLRIWRQHPEIAIGTTKRGPLRGGWRKAAGNASVSFIIIPTFGRKLMRLWSRDTAGGNLFVDYGFASPGIETNAAAATLWFGTANTLVVPAAPAFLSFETTDLPDWITVRDAAGAGNQIELLLVEVYD